MAILTMAFADRLVADTSSSWSNTVSIGMRNDLATRVFEPSLTDHNLLKRANKLFLLKILYDSRPCCGAGLSVLPCFIADLAPNLIRVMTPKEVFTQNIWLTMHHDISKLSRIRAVAHFLQTALQRNDTHLLGLKNELKSLTR